MCSKGDFHEKMKIIQKFENTVVFGSVDFLQVFMNFESATKVRIRWL
jgi:hypothetical protein